MRDRIACRWDQTDAALLALVRLVLDHSWTPDGAAAELRAKVGDDSLLLRVRSRVRAALADHPTPLGLRAAETLDLALAPAEAAVHAVNAPQPKAV